MKLTAKKKYNIIRLVSAIGLIIHPLLVSVIAVLLNWDLLWKGIETEGVTSFGQWLSLIVYRVMLYIFPAIVLMQIPFDKRYKKSSLFVIWLNWTFAVYLIISLFIKVFAFDMLLDISVFNTLDSFVGLSGFVLTAILKKKIELGTVGAIIGEKP